MVALITLVIFIKSNDTFLDMSIGSLDISFLYIVVATTPKYRIMNNEIKIQVLPQKY